ncbi:MAG: hypothetical protein E7L23_13775, partial [Klebsiella grimontii]|nr:hypothetical protein [Klebsiella grimontii]
MNRTYLSTKACGLSNLVAHSQKQIHHSGRIIVVGPRLAPIFPDTFYRLTHYWFAAADIPVANDIPVH